MHREQLNGKQTWFSILQDISITDASPVRPVGFPPPPYEYSSHACCHMSLGGFGSGFLVDFVQRLGFALFTVLFIPSDSPPCVSRLQINSNFFFFFFLSSGSTRTFHVATFKSETPRDSARRRISSLRDLRTAPAATVRKRL